MQKSHLFSPLKRIDNCFADVADLPKTAEGHNTHIIHLHVTCLLDTFKCLIDILGNCAEYKVMHVKLSF